MGNSVAEAEAKLAWMDGLVAACTLGAVILAISAISCFLLAYQNT